MRVDETWQQRRVAEVDHGGVGGGLTADRLNPVTEDDYNARLLKLIALSIEEPRRLQHIGMGGQRGRQRKQNEGEIVETQSHGRTYSVAGLQAMVGAVRCNLSCLPVPRRRRPGGVFRAGETVSFGCALFDVRRPWRALLPVAAQRERRPV